MPSETERMAAFACGTCHSTRASGYDQPSNAIQTLTCEGLCGRATVHTFVGLRMFLREFDQRTIDRKSIRVQVRYTLVE